MQCQILQKRESVIRCKIRACRCHIWALGAGIRLKMPKRWRSHRPLDMMFPENGDVSSFASGFSIGLSAEKLNKIINIIKINSCHIWFLYKFLFNFSVLSTDINTGLNYETASMLTHPRGKGVAVINVAVHWLVPGPGSHCRGFFVILRSVCYSYSHYY